MVWTARSSLTRETSRAPGELGGGEPALVEKIEVKGEDRRSLRSRRKGAWERCGRFSTSDANGRGQSGRGAGNLHETCWAREEGGSRPTTAHKPNQSRRINAGLHVQITCMTKSTMTLIVCPVTLIGPRLTPGTRPSAAMSSGVCQRPSGHDQRTFVPPGQFCSSAFDFGTVGRAQGLSQDRSEFSAPVCTMPEQGERWLTATPIKGAR